MSLTARRLTSRRICRAWSKAASCSPTPGKYGHDGPRRAPLGETRRAARGRRHSTARPDEAHINRAKWRTVRRVALSHLHRRFWLEFGCASGLAREFWVDPRFAE